jgi:prepilin peptidase CpaA
MKIFLLILLGMVLVYVCYTDIRYRRITNKTIALIAILSLLLGFVVQGSLSILLPLGILIIGFFISTLGIVGAADTKLVVALCLSLSVGETGDFLFFTALIGIPLSLITLCFYRLLRSTKTGVTIPYGVAISLGYGIHWGVSYVL